MAIRQRMLALEPRILGRVITPSTFTATTVVSTTDLATGTVGAGRYGGRFLLRPTATLSGGLAVDRLRVVTETGYASTTGTLTHAGAAYTDQTVGTEIVELHEFDPRDLDLKINEAVRQVRRRDTQVLPLRNDGRYDLAQFAWLDRPELITRIGQRPLEVLTPNRHFDAWGTVSTAGVLQPDSWTLAGTAGVFTRSTVARRGRYALSAQRVGNDITVDVVIPAHYSFAADDDLRGDIVTAGLVARSANGSSVRARVTSEDGSFVVLSTTNSSYHTGGGAWEELTAVHTVHASAEWIRCQARVEVNETALLDECFLAFANGLTDTLRRDDPPVQWLDRPYNLQQNPLMLYGPHGRTQQLIVESERPYPTFDATRLAGGLADADETDCPLDLAAYKAAALFFASRATENARMEALAAKYARMADDLQAQHLYVPSEPTPGAHMLASHAYGRRGRGL